MNFNAKMDRRRLLQNAGMMGAGAAIAACSPGVVAQDPPTTNIDPAVLNFALNLEYLEAEFYLAAVGRPPTYGTGAGAAMTGGAAVSGGRMVDWNADLGGALTPEFRANVRAMAEEIATDEENHVKFLRSALGASAVARPAINIGTAFGAAADAAFAADVPAGLTPKFDPYANALFFLHGAFIFEDVGVTAYKGAARLITNKDFLEAAAGILAVEAYHSGEIRTELYRFRDVMSPYGVDVKTIVQKISNLRDAVDGADDRDQGIVGSLAGNPAYATAANIVVTDANGIAFSRTTDQVLAIVYLGDKTKPGGFFPMGLNGDIK